MRHLYRKTHIRDTKDAKNFESNGQKQSSISFNQMNKLKRMLYYTQLWI